MNLADVVFYDHCVADAYHRLCAMLLNAYRRNQMPYYLYQVRTTLQKLEQLITPAVDLPPIRRHDHSETIWKIVGGRTASQSEGLATLSLRPSFQWVSTLPGACMRSLSKSGMKQSRLTHVGAVRQSADVRACPQAVRGPMVSRFESLPPMVGARTRFVRYCLPLRDIGNARASRLPGFAPDR